MATLLHDCSPAEQKFSIVSPAAEQKAISPAASAHLDLIRGLAAIAVLVGHARNLFLYDFGQLHHPNVPIAVIYALTILGHQAVMVFFVLSGFLVGSSVVRSITTGKWSTARYCLHRFTRLEIVLLPALILSLILDWSGIHAFGLSGVYGGHSLSYILVFNVPSHISPLIFLGNLGFQQSLHVPCLGTNTPLWSLSNEFWYYVLFPSLALVLVPHLRRRVRMLSFLICVAAAWAMGLSLISYFPIWLLGVGVYYLPAPTLSKFAAKWMLGGAITLALCALFLSKSYLKDGLLSDYIVGCTFAFFLYWLLHQWTHVGNLYATFAKKIAAPSFTLYVVHLPLLALLSAWIGSRWYPTPEHLTWTFGILCLTWGYAWLVYKCFEANTNRWRAWIERKLLGHEK